MTFEYNENSYRLNISNQTIVNLDTCEVIPLEDIRDFQLIELIKGLI